MAAARSRTAADTRCRWPRAPPAARMSRPCTVPRAPPTAAAAPPPEPRAGSSRAWSPSACLSRRRWSRSATAAAEGVSPGSQVACPTSGGIAGAGPVVPSGYVRRVASGVVADRAGAGADPRVRGRGRGRRRRHGPVVRRRISCSARSPSAPFVLWTYRPGLPLLALSLAVIVPVVAAQRSGQLEPLLFEVSLLAFVVGAGRPSTARGRRARPARRARARGRERDPGSVGDRGGHLDHGRRVPLGVRPCGRAPGGARRPAPGHQARARPAGAAGRAAPDRPRRPRLRRAWAGCRDAPGHERPPRAASRPGGGRGGAAFGRGGRPAQHA